ncbi:MAG: CCA tRNA nucleotidyltransferase [Lachnospiraceae bacterium]|nr:CCA tRNA nucleotidyltransferase [Lachnospiraceae bacterium]
MEKIILPDQVNTIIHRLQSAGHEAYAVGGCVRDRLLGRTPGDWDITTSARPLEVKSLFGHTVDTGIAHGTVTVLIDHKGFEVTTYRIDGEYEDARHPKQVEFTSQLSLDLSRRDFTINAMAYNDEAGIIDLFGGIKDIENRIVRCVGNPDSRFKEDALRIMRAVRFCAQLDFQIEPQTLLAIASHAGELSRISAERIRVELTKLLLSDHPERLLTAQETGLTAVFLPEFDRMLATAQENPHHIYNVGMHTIHALSYLAGLTTKAGTMAWADKKPQGDDIPQQARNLFILSSLSPKEHTILRYALLLHDCAKPLDKTIDPDGIAHFIGHDWDGAVLAEQILRRLKFDNETIHVVSHLVKMHDMRYGESGKKVKERTVRRALSRVGTTYFDLLTLLQEADLNAQNPALLPEKLNQLWQARQIADKIRAKGQCISLKELAVNGSDLICAGIKPGPQVGQRLNELLDYVIEYPEKNNREDLLLYLGILLTEPSPKPSNTPQIL